MNKDDKDQLTDELIGEAMLSLLKQKGPINTSALRQRLVTMQIQELDPKKNQALEQIIKEMDILTARRHGPMHKAGTKDRESRETVVSMSGRNHSSGRDKLH
ncbi:hypothetical protein TUM12370_13550 [Salmonella enterica subsp. enterica serovar Choleraesuis]|nr:hypothetical protein TUM12370_13550 [Salmonella enterica subsp. enterica serovar Choleraesuis]